MTRRRHGGRELTGILNAQMAGKFDSPTNRGVRKRMDTNVIAGGFELVQTQLISVRLDKGPRQLLVTLMQPSKGASGTTPWIASWDNTTTAPNTAGSVFTAPRLPDAAKGLRCELRWGAGGAAGVTQFDYPAVGSTFGLTADTIDLHILKPIDVGTPFVYTEPTVPFVGAFLCEGQAADPTPLRWLELFTDLANGATQYYMAKPFARTVHIAADGDSCTVDWLDAANGVLYRQRYVEPVAGAGIDVVVQVPAQATTMAIGNNSGADFDFLCVEWNIGLV